MHTLAKIFCCTFHTSYLDALWYSDSLTISNSQTSCHIFYTLTFLHIYVHDHNKPYHLCMPHYKNNTWTCHYQHKYLHAFHTTCQLQISYHIFQKLNTFYTFWNASFVLLLSWILLNEWYILSLTSLLIYCLILILTLLLVQLPLMSKMIMTHIYNWLIITWIFLNIMKEKFKITYIFQCFLTWCCYSWISICYSCLSSNYWCL